jgi:hypothetical protein
VVARGPVGASWKALGARGGPKVDEKSRLGWRGAKSRKLSRSEGKELLFVLKSTLDRDGPSLPRYEAERCCAESLESLYRAGAGDLSRGERRDSFES